LQGLLFRQFDVNDFSQNEFLFVALRTPLMLKTARRNCEESEIVVRQKKFSPLDIFCFDL
jgi:hypothetical protein